MQEEGRPPAHTPDKTDEQPAGPEIDGDSYIGGPGACEGLSRQTRDIIKASWRETTRKQYTSYIRKWFSFCHPRQKDPYHPTVGLILEFLTQLYESGLGYSAINTARSAISSFVIVDNTPAGQIPIIQRFLKGVFNLRPTLPKTISLGT